MPLREKVLPSDLHNEVHRFFSLWAACSWLMVNSAKRDRYYLARNVKRRDSQSEITCAVAPKFLLTGIAIRLRFRASLKLFVNDGSIGRS
jgi:hypothetical protein